MKKTFKKSTFTSMKGRKKGGASRTGRAEALRRVSLRKVFRGGKKCSREKKCVVTGSCHVEERLCLGGHKSKRHAIREGKGGERGKTLLERAVAVWRDVWEKQKPKRGGGGAGSWF